MKTYMVYSAKPGETWAPNFKLSNTVRARGPLDAARRYLGKEFRRLAVCRFTNGAADFIFDRSMPQRLHVENL
jgi:hypothetical protein